MSRFEPDRDYYSIKPLEDTGLVKAFYTNKKNSVWKLGLDGTTRNYTNLSETFDITPLRIVRADQTHTNVVRAVSLENGGEGCTKEFSFRNYDALVTSEKKFLLCTTEADCVPVYFLDTEKKVIAMAHSGWRGTCGLISRATIEKMQSDFGTKPENIIAVIGPCICKNCYEVGKELIEKFSVNFNKDIEKIFIPKSEEKYFLDLNAAIRITLLSGGINPEKIFCTEKCTFESIDLCSYRRTGSKIDHMLTGIMLV